MQRKDNVVDNFYNTEVRDPYRYLEDSHDPDTLDFISRQAARAEAYLSKIPARANLKARLTELWDYPKYGTPKKQGDKYYFLKNNGLENQHVLYSQANFDAPAQKVIDPNLFSLDGTIALMHTAVSRNGRYLAYSRSASGSDWQEVRVLDLESGKELGETLRHVKFTNLSWDSDSSGFYYSRFLAPATVAPEEQSYHSKVYFHLLDTAQEADRLIYERPEAKELGFSVNVSEDGRYLYLFVWHGTDPENRFYYKDLAVGGEGAGTGEVIRLLDDADASYAVLGNIGSVFYFLTNLEVPKGRIIAIDVSKPERAGWREIVAGGDDAIAEAKLYNRKLVITYLTHAHHQVKIFSLDGAYEVTLALPTVGSLVETTGKMDDSEMFLSFTSFFFPATPYRLDLNTLILTRIWETAGKFTPEDYEARQFFYNSSDGTAVPLFIAHKKGLVPTGETPTLLYGYGGFNVNMTPGFSVGTLAWLDRGGVYALACLRGGGEYGEDWHRAGMLERKQQVFDDFHAAAEYLVEAGYTSPKHLGIMGGSNGGLLVAACMLQRPELYGAIVCRVPVIDMLRYHKFTVGRYWVGEYGNAEASAEHFAFLYAYSPLHNVKAGAEYPPTLIMTADTDDRVVPAHAFKFMATLEEDYTGTNPLFLRIERKAGHGAGKPTSKLIDEAADLYAFLAATIG